VLADSPGSTDGHIDIELDSHCYVVKGCATKYLVRAAGDSMIDDGIHHSDSLLVNLSLEAPLGRIIVIAVIDECR
jgi:SOS-response transcriptional repressor LexA